MKRCSLGLAVFLGCGITGLGGIGCGSTTPAVTVPAPNPAAEAKAEAAPAPAPPAAPDGLVPPEPTLRLPRNFLPTGYAARL